MATTTPRDSPAVRAQLLTLSTAYELSGRQVHDANIAAPTLANGITHLLIFSVGDFRRFAGLTTIENGPSA